MASDINRVVLIGRLVKDPDLRYTQGGSSVASFSVANNRSYVSSGEKKEIVSYFNCVAWGKLGELIVQYTKKGHRIGIEGRLQQRSWEDQNGNKRSTVEVIVENFQFLTPKGSGQEGGDDIPTPAPDSEPNPFSDEDIPF
ncbi:MAG: single-stranded DNA-binding protein [Spirochaetes bacterium]|nr:single-stranded DNA-binding protein [Spirochaetota bacterium]